MVGASFFIPPAVPEAKLSHTRAKLGGGRGGGNDEKWREEWRWKEGLSKYGANAIFNAKFELVYDKIYCQTLHTYTQG